MEVKQENPAKKAPRKRKAAAEGDGKKPLKCKKPKIEPPDEIKHEAKEETWQDYELLAEQQNLDPDVAQSVWKLFKEGNTIPFIARYRRGVSGNMSAEELREVKNSYDSVCCLKEKKQSVLKSIEKSGKLSPKLRHAIVSSRTLEELEYICAPYKPGGKRSLAERAKELGLEEPAMAVLENIKNINLYEFVSADNEELKTVELVKKGIVHIIASVIATDTELLNFLREIRQRSHFLIETKKSASKVKKENADESKFENYFDFKIPSIHIKPHQVLAINRGEAQKILSVKINVPDFLYEKFSNFCNHKWNYKGKHNEERKYMMNEAISDSYNRLVQPLIIREVRAELKNKAEKASYEVFSTNLKQLLLMPPLKGCRILGVDPGYAHGCKLAVVSETGDLLDHDVIYPHKNSNNRSEVTLKNMLQKHGCSLIALGNGTACRKTEEWISSLIQSGAFKPLDVTYTIVDENGASIYSCSPEAKKEFPNLDPNIISALSLARRLQDPLAELVKVEPKHLGVGMYQHDLKKKQLEEALEEVVSECVSFVGVDLNTASQCLLKHVAGLTEKRASQIIECREKKGPFLSRKQLLEIKGIGNRTYEQCVGFLRVEPTSQSFYNQPETNRLDCTYIHTESYEVAEKLIKLLGLNVENVGQEDFIAALKRALHANDEPELCKKLSASAETVDLIIEALSKPLSHDLRSERGQAPLFKKGLTSMADFTAGTVLTGRVNNVTHFGCFVDVGVECNGLIHNSQMKGVKLQVGDRAEVEVLNIDLNRKRLALKALKRL